MKQERFHCFPLFHISGHIWPFLANFAQFFLNLAHFFAHAHCSYFFLLFLSFFTTFCLFFAFFSRFGPKPKNLSVGKSFLGWFFPFFLKKNIFFQKKLKNTLNSWIFHNFSHYFGPFALFYPICHLSKGHFCQFLLFFPIIFSRLTYFSGPRPFFPIFGLFFALSSPWQAPLGSFGQAVTPFGQPSGPFGQGKSVFAFFCQFLALFWPFLAPFGQPFGPFGHRKSVFWHFSPYLPNFS